MSLTRYIIRRMLLQVFVLVGVSSLTFFMMIVMPGDPATIIMETTGGISTEAVEKFRERWGFDKPAYLQYITFMWNLVRGDFGESFVTRREISAELGSFLPATAELSVVAFLMAVMMAIPAGILAAVKRNALPDHVVRIVSLFGTSMPIFWFAIILLLVFFFYLGWVPSSQRIGITLDVPQTVTGFYTIDTLIVGDFRGFVSALHHLALPAFVLAFSVVGLLARVTRTSMLEVLGEDYIRMAHAKGLHNRVVLYRHALRNAMIPTVTILGLLVGGLLSGAVLTETIFAWPGLGRFAVQSIFFLDRAAVTSVALIIGIAYSTANLIVDIAVAVLDPRITYT